MPESSIQLDFVSAEKVLDDIKNSQEIEIENKKIIGNLILDKLYIIYKSIRIKNSIIEGKLDFNSVHFKSKVSFIDVIFTKDINFIDTKFDENLEISGSSFCGDIFFVGSIIHGDATFNGSRFKSINIANTRFKKYVYFKKTSSQEDFVLLDSFFLNKINFDGSYFKSRAYFKRIAFSGEAEFKDVLFGKDASFDNSIFKKDVRFNDSFFGGKVGFRESKFLKDVYFCSDKITPMGVTFCREVDLYDAEFNRLFITWISIKNNLIFNRTVMAKLISNFEKIDKPDDADECYYYYRNCLKNKRCKRIHADMQNMSAAYMLFIKAHLIPEIENPPDKADSKMLNLPNSSRAYDYVEWAISGYGVKQRRVIAVLFILTAFFGLVFWLGNGISSNIDFGNSPPISINESLANSFIFSAICLIAKIPTDIKATGYFTFVALFESILGWLILAIFISNLIEYNERKKKRI